MVQDIFPRRSQTAETVLGGTDLRRVLIVPIDFAKKTHVAQLVSAPSEAWCFLPGASPGRVRLDQPPVSSVAPL